MTYTLEAMDENDKWHVVRTYPLSSTAQAGMLHYRSMYSQLPLRVCEEPTRLLVVLNDPRPL